jgi:hypothetical protein
MYPEQWFFQPTFKQEIKEVEKVSWSYSIEEQKNGTLLPMAGTFALVGVHICPTRRQFC